MIEQTLKALLPPEDYIHGFADLKGLLIEEFRDYPYGISIGKKLDGKIVDRIENGPTPEYLEHYKQVNTELAELSCRICEELRRENIRCLPVIPTVGTGSGPYLDALRYKISHKMVATRAGLGWIGKTDLFISKEFGPRLRLVSILTDRPINSTAKPVDKSRCGRCEICVVKCPAGAANGKSWDIHTHRDEFFDAQKCRSKCRELSLKFLKKDSSVCGICVSVCPLGKKDK